MSRNWKLQISSNKTERIDDNYLTNIYTNSHFCESQGGRVQIQIHLIPEISGFGHLRRYQLFEKSSPYVNLPNANLFITAIERQSAITVDLTSWTRRLNLSDQISEKRKKKKQTFRASVTDGKVFATNSLFLWPKRESPLRLGRVDCSGESATSQSLSRNTKERR